MNKQETYPKSIGEELWLYFILLIDAHIGRLETTIVDLSQNSNIPITHIKPILNKLVKHGFINLKKSPNKSLQIRLKHYGTKMRLVSNSKLIEA